MAKKKAIKLATATAIAASAFAAAAPIQTSAAVNVDTVVKDAVKKMVEAQNSFVAKATDKKLVDVKTVQAKQAEATKVYTAAKATVKKSGGKNTAALNAKLDAAKKTMDYRINNFVTARKEVSALAVANQAVKKAEAAQLEAKVKELEAQLAKTEAVVAKVIGASTRDKMTAVAVTPSKATLEKAKAELAMAKVASVTVVNETTVTVKLETAKTGLDAKNFKVLVDGTAVTPSAVVADATGANYTLTVASLKDKAGKVTVNGKESAYDFTAPKVVSVSAINATQVEVKFNKAVDPTSLFTNGKNGAFKATVTLTTIDSVASGNLTGELSADGKTLTVTAQNALSKRYDVVVDGVKTTDAKDVAKYAEMITIDADKTAPTIISTTKLSASSFKVKFSEPIKSLGAVSYKLADGTVVASGGNGVTDDFTAGTQEVTFTVGSDVAAGKEVIATFIGAQDQAGNLLAPNPATVSFVKGNLDGVAPTVSSITQTGATTFAVKFSEQLLAAPTITVNGTAAAKVEKDSNDPTLYNVTAAGVLDGASTVAISAFTDLSGEPGTTLSKVVTFIKDTATPKVVSSAVVADATDKKEYLEITFDKDVVLGAAPTVDVTSGSYLKDYVTTSIADADITAKAVTYKSLTNKKVVRVELGSLLGAKNVKGAAYTLNLKFADVTTASSYAAADATVTFTRGEDGTAANADVVKVTKFEPVVTDNNKVEVTFDKAVDGASATNVANYRIDGAIVESVTLKPFDTVSGTQVAVVNLKAGSNGFTGTRNINISDVKALGSSKVMEAYFANNIELKENVAPVVTSAKLTATDKVTLTFSEKVKDTTGLDFEVLIGGQSQATAENVDALIGATATNTVTITISPIDATKLAKGISLKALTTLDITDGVGNKLSVPSNITVSN